MPFHVLIVSEDTDSCAKLSRLFPGVGASVQSCGYGRGGPRLSEQRFDVVAIDFDDPQGATSIVESCSHMSPGARVIILALLTDKTKLRHAFGAGANFVLYKPFSDDQARATLFDVAVLVKKERRSTPRVPVQMAIQLKVPGGQGMEAIALALSQHGMEVLAAQPLCPSSKIETIFRLPGSSSQLQLQGEVAWASPNGHAGVRFDFAGQGAEEHGLLGNTAILGVLKEWVSNNADSSGPEDEASQNPEELKPNYRLTDLSPGGCYIETQTPFHKGVELMLSFTLSGVGLHTVGVVRIEHPAFGMGVEFLVSSVNEDETGHQAAERCAEHQSRIADFIRLLTAQRGAVPDVTVIQRPFAEASVRHVPNPCTELSDPLLTLLRTRGTISREDFLEKLRRDRVCPEAAVPV